MKKRDSGVCAAIPFFSSGCLTSRMRRLQVFFTFTKGSYDNLRKASRIRIRPPSHEILKDNLPAARFPRTAPQITAMASVKKEHKKTANPFTFPKAAPRPAARPSKDRAMARETASFGEIVLEWSVSAHSGLA